VTGTAAINASDQIQVAQQTYLDVMANLESAGYTIVETKRTLLGRVKILAENSVHLREVVVSRATGEVKRDEVIRIFAEAGIHGEGQSGSLWSKLFGGIGSASPGAAAGSGAGTSAATGLGSLSGGLSSTIDGSLSAAGGSASGSLGGSVSAGDGSASGSVDSTVSGTVDGVGSATGDLSGGLGLGN
jgi:hypothetical protein